MIPLLLASALAADIGEWSGPFQVVEAPDGDLVVLDNRNRAIPAQKVLQTLSPEDGAQYGTNRKTRKGIAFALWIVGSGVTTGGVISGFNSVPAGLLWSGIGLGGITSGYLLLYAPREERLDNWITEEALVQGLLVLEDAPPEATKQVRAGWRVTEQGRVMDGHRRVSIEELSLAIGDEARAEEWRRWQRAQYRTWTGAMVVGTAVAGFGVGYGVAAQGDLRGEAGAFATMAVGGVMVAGGVAGMIATDEGFHVARWFTPEELEEAVHGSETVSRVESRPPPITVLPVVAPGYLGIQGSF